MKRGLLYGGIALIILSALWWAMHRRDTRRDTEITSPALKTDEQSKTIIDVPHHTVTTVRRSGTTRTFLNTHGPVAVVEKRDGSTVLLQRTWGTMHSPFVGVAFGSDIRIRGAIGVNLFYVQRWELGGGLLLNQAVKDTRAYIALTYNIEGNCLVGLGFDNRKTAQALAALRF